MILPDILLCIFLITAVALSYYSGKLTLAGALTGGLIALLIYKGAGYTGIAMLALFFIAGSWATGWRIQQKVAIGAAEKRKGRRTAGQVVANGGVAGLLGAIAWRFHTSAPLLQIMMAGSLAAAMADTLSSELGTIYGRRFYHILNLKPDQRGLDGVVSLEGTLIGIAGAGLMAMVYGVGFGWSIQLCWIIVAGAIGNLVDSILGAAFERRQRMGNNMVNFLNTLIGALVCLALMSAFS